MRGADRYFEELKGKKVGFIGAGVSHFDCILLFLKKGIDVYLFDKNTEIEGGDELIEAGCKFILGDDYLDELFSMDIVFRTPGFYFGDSIIRKLRDSGVYVTSETETFFELCPAFVYAVSGSDGKTTTTTIISEILKEAGERVFLGGNIGRALLPMIEEVKSSDIIVAELSSFQLISHSYSPDVAVITNITPNHLNVHKDMDEYTNCKRNLLLHQNGYSRAVLGADNEGSAALADDVRGRLYTFSNGNEVGHGAYCDEKGDIYFRDFGKSDIFIMNKSDIKIVGEHNVLNYLAAISATMPRVSADVIKKVAMNFGGVEHRIELVREIDGVRYYNDSIASSPTRVIAGLLAFDEQLIVIAGGSDKKVSFAPLSPVLCERAKAVILTGETADKIEKSVLTCPDYDADKLKIYKVDSMKEAVDTAYKIAVAGDVVTLSPACASFDRYKNFEHRGRDFKQIVMNIEEK